MHSTSSEERFSVAPPDSPYCAYAWEKGEVQFRAEYVYSYRWGPAEAFGYGALPPHVGQLAATCPASEQPALQQAQVSVYYLEYGPKAYGYASAIPYAFLLGLTLGAMPYPNFRSYAVCVQVRGEGLARSAIAEGKLSSLQNLWGGGNSRFRQGKEETLQEKTQLMQTLTTQAWHKLWQTGAESSGEDCRARLDAMVS